MASREDVIVRFGGDAKALTRTLGGIRSEVSAMTGGFNQLQGILSAVGVTAALTAIQNTLSWADDLAETADRVGLTTDAIQSLRLEAELFGVTTEEVDSALTKFSINLGKARQGTGDLYAIFRQYNQSLGGTATEVLERYILLLQRARSEAEQNRIAVAGFGKAGAKMAQSIAESGMPLDQMIAKFRDLGMVIDEEGVRAAGELADEFDRLWQQTKILGMQGVIGVNDFVNTTALGFRRLAKLMDEWRKGNFVSMQDIVNGEKAPGGAAPGKGKGGDSLTEVGPTEKFREELEKRRVAAKSATELELEIWRQYSRERASLSMGDDEAARKAQEEQEAALSALAKAGVSKAMMRTYEDLVGRMEKTAVEIKAKTTLEIVNADSIGGQIQAGLNGELLQITLEVTPQLNAADLDGYMLWTSGGNGEPPDIARDINKAADAEGANP